MRARRNIPRRPFLPQGDAHALPFRRGQVAWIDISKKDQARKCDADKDHCQEDEELGDIGRPFGAAAATGLHLRVVRRGAAWLEPLRSRCCRRGRGGARQWRWLRDCGRRRGSGDRRLFTRCLGRHGGIGRCPVHVGRPRLGLGGCGAVPGRHGQGRCTPQHLTRVVDDRPIGVRQGFGRFQDVFRRADLK